MKHEEKQMKVFESNDLIRRSGSRMTMLQQKTLLYLISQINPYDKPNQTFSANIMDICRVCNLDTKDGGAYITLVKDIIKNGLTETMGWIRTENGIRQFAWLRNEVEILDDGTIRYQYTTTVQEHLFELRERFTAYELLNVLALKSKHAIRLFEVLKSYESVGECDLILDDLKKELGVTYRESEKGPWIEKYPKFFDFEKRVLIPCQIEINTVSRDFHFSYSVSRRMKRKVYSLHFTITPHDPRSQWTKSNAAERARRLTPKQE